MGRFGTVWHGLGRWKAFRGGFAQTDWRGERVEVAGFFDLDGALSET